MLRLSRSWPLGYGVAVGSTLVALLLSLALRPLIAADPFLLFFAAVTLSAAFGLGPGLLATVLSVTAVNYFFLPPFETFVFDPPDLARIALFSLIAVLISSLQNRRARAEGAVSAQRERLRVTLSSIGDAVIATDIQGRIDFMNPVAEALTGWPQGEAALKDVQEVFQIVNEQTRQPVENPVVRVIRDGAVVGLANNTILIRPDGTERAIDDSGAPIRDENDKLVGAVLTFRDITQRRQEEKAQRFLADATVTLASSLDYEATLRNVARLAVPGIADWCAVHIVEPGGAIRQLAIAHSDPEKVAWVQDYQRRNPPNPAAPRGVYKVLRTAETEFYPEITDEMLSAAVRDPEQLRQVRAMGFTSAIIVPLVVRGRVLGAIQCATAESRRNYSQADVDLLEQLGRRAAVAIDNARLYRDAQEAHQTAAFALNQTARLQNITAALAQIRTPVEAARAVVDETLPALESAHSGLVALLADDGTALEIVYDSGYPEPNLRPYRRMPMDAALPLPDVVRNMQPMFIESSEDFRERYPQIVGQMLSPSMALLPLMLNSHAIGGMVISFSKPQTFPVSDRAFLLSIAQQCAQALDRARLYEAERKAHTEAEAAQQRLRVTLASIGDAVIATDAQGRVTFMNAVAQNLTGWSQQDAAGEPLAEVFHIINEETRQEVENPAMKVIRLGAIIGLANHTVLIAKDGREIPIDDSGAPIRDGEGNIIGVILVFRDITERKRAEDTEHFLANVGMALAASLDYETTLQKVAQLVVAVLADTCVVDIVDGGEIRRIAVAARDKATAATLRDLQQRYPPDWDEPGGVAEVLRTGKPLLTADVTDEMLAANARDEAHLRLVREVRYRSVMVVPLNFQDRTLGVISFGTVQSGRRYGPDDLVLAQELGYRAALAVENARLYREAQRAIRARDEFLSVAAHELRTPVTSLRGFAQLLLRQIDRDRALDLLRVQRALQNIDQQSNKLTRLVAQLLDVSRIEAGRLALDWQETDLAALVESVAAVTRTNAPLHTITVRSLSPLIIQADPIRLEQVLTNLLDNAVKYSPAGGPIEVDVARSDGDRVRVAITDHGIGIPQEHRPHIFDRFYRAHGSGNFGGMGLGLYISRQIVELHGGAIVVEFPAEGGSCFVVTLPVRPAPLTTAS